ncbi:class II fructose-1,6-bisphosphate aldolase [Mycoplasma nasistruthionis]|uniref:Class II fructose-1,6-bisphosphate aldolase n=1 Tax=Mycoplasma nasistruthionis TaxID=353852 RepID=A0A4Y6I5A1_9MOLU|nr:class II fructose-1,6-bisphosphate aldolase [Mycoplasma nasistruthionis]QDF64785.1 class II fructose-1,6-bisphosphate aldolase [Mycoplasma nasistruthionis]
MALVNAKDMLKKAKKNKYAIPHFNINNLEWLKAIVLTAEKLKSPVILGVSEGALKYMGGYSTVSGMVLGFLNDNKISIPVALHLDHGSFEGCLKAIESEGFTSIMFDGSRLDFETNYEQTNQLVYLANNKNMSIEAEVGSIGGEEDGIVGQGELADVKQAVKMANLGITVLAAGIGNIHGPYPSNWKGLDFDRLFDLSQNTGIGIVLHGGSGINAEDIKKAISLGITKINVNTELQLANHKAIREFIKSDKDLEAKNYDPRKLLKPGFEAMCQAVENLIKLFGSDQKAN